jgi:hypothetical protein|tara:strand:+ start:71 stop:307 length:237 start_codon:yes stop_codon:yes gene_type:complete
MTKIKEIPFFHTPNDFSEITDYIYKTIPDMSDDEIRKNGGTSSRQNAIIAVAMTWNLLAKQAGNGKITYHQNTTGIRN